MKSIWKGTYTYIKTAVTNLDSTEALLKQTVGAIAKTYSTNCLLWAGLQEANSDSLRVYAMPGLERASEQTGSHFSQLPHPNDLSPTTPPPELALPHDDRFPVQQYRPPTIPPWLEQQQHNPQLLQLETGDLIIPVTSRNYETYAQSSGIPHHSLQFVLQLSRPLPPAADSPADPVGDDRSPPLNTAGIQGWSVEELDSIDIVCSQLEMAYSALYWRERLEQSRQQAALVGRIARLLNSSLNPDEIVGRIAGELGQGLQCDQCILVDLRDDPVHVLATWTHPERNLAALEQTQIDRSLWHNVVEMFLQGGASFLEIAAADPQPEPLQTWLQEIKAASVLLIPLFIQSEFFGTVALLSYRQRTYQIDELQMIRQVADQAAIALTNAKHYQSLWHKQEALRLQNNSLRLEVIQDDLTQLLNRRSLERELEQLSARAVWSVQPTFSIIVCDIDYFKLVNDTYGHRIGDEVLRSIAVCIQKQLRRETHAYRYGGEEFVVILTETPLSRAEDVAERLRLAIRSTPIATTAGTVAITASFGIAQQQSTLDRNAWDVLQRADQALYSAKRQGRDRVEALKQPC